jgi:hypothetical protein
MMTREEIKEIVDYSQEHGITIKRRLQELNVSESNFYCLLVVHIENVMICPFWLSNDLPFSM